MNNTILKEATKEASRLLDILFENKINYIVELDDIGDDTIAKTDSNALRSTIQKIIVNSEIDPILQKAGLTQEHIKKSFIADSILYVYAQMVYELIIDQSSELKIAMSEVLRQYATKDQKEKDIFTEGLVKYIRIKEYDEEYMHYISSHYAIDPELMAFYNIIIPGINNLVNVKEEENKRTAFKD